MMMPRMRRHHLAESADLAQSWELWWVLRAMGGNLFNLYLRDRPHHRDFDQYFDQDRRGKFDLFFILHLPLVIITRRMQPNPTYSTTVLHPFVTCYHQRKVCKHHINHHIVIFVLISSLWRRPGCRGFDRWGLSICCCFGWVWPKQIFLVEFDQQKSELACLGCRSFDRWRHSRLGCIHRTGFQVQTSKYPKIQTSKSEGSKFQESKYPKIPKFRLHVDMWHKLFC